MEESILISQNKSTLKNMAIVRGLSSSGFNGRTISRMRKKDFIDYLLLHPSPSEDDEDSSLEEEVTHFIFNAFPPFIQLFENLTVQNKMIQNKEVQEREPLEEDETVPNLNTDEVKDKTILNNIKNLEIKVTCVVCQTNMRNIVFNPCNHLATCIRCSKSLSNTCPLCRAMFTSKSRIFF